jgi:hypothetical protein
VSPSGDRVGVPTNGHRPRLDDPAAALGLGGLEGTTDVEDATDLGAGRPTIHVSSATGPSLPTVSTGQLAAGFGILVAVALLILGRRRGRQG